jgi:hypothetical protein
MAEKQEKARDLVEPVQEPKTEEPKAPKAPSAPTLKLVLAKDEDASEVAVAVPGLSPDDDYTDEHGRVVVSSTPVTVPAAVGDLIVTGAPYVEVAR